MSSVPSGERRQITLMLCDVVDYSSLTEQLDPEDLADLMQPFRRRCATIISRHGGVVAQYLGDAVLAYFGYPGAHEDDAERAIRAALDIVSAEEGSPRQVPLHVGIATGNVVVGMFDEVSQAVHHGAAPRDGSDVSAFGKALVLVKRLQELATPGAVVVSEQTRRLCRGVFEYQNLGRHQFKRLPEPVQAWQVKGESRIPSRFHALRAAEFTPLVNRRAELQEISRLWESAKAGRGSALLVSGEPGVGKSRLADEISRQVVGSGGMRLQYFCSSHLQSSPLAPLIRQLPRVAGFADDDDDRARLQKLRAFSAAASVDANEVVPLLATLLSIPYEEIYPPLGMSPQRQRRRLFELLIDLLKAAASFRPVLFVVEDLHWIDPSSDELVGMAVEASAQLPALIMITTRPEYPPHWHNRPHLAEMRLGTLDRHDSLAMIEWLCRDQLVPDGAAVAIADRADGLPLFIEDLTKDILELSELHQHLDGPTRAQRLHGQIPATLKDTLMSRLDRLGSAKEIAQIGAAIGREFSYRLLSRVADRREEGLKEEIHRLVGSGLLEARPSATAATYAFKHALVRDAAYSSLLKKEQIALHARIAEALVNEFPETVDAQPEVLAYHLQTAGDIDRAVIAWINAARLSARRSGFVEAISQLQGALLLLDTQRKTRDRARLELRVHMALGGIYAEHRGFSSVECGQAYAHALALCEHLGDAPQVFAALSGVGSFEITRGNLIRSRALAEKCLELATGQALKPPFVMGHLLLGGTLFLNGEFETSRSHLEEAIRLYEEDQPSRKGRQVLYVQDQKATGLCYLGLTLTIMGHLGPGLDAAREGVRHARSLGGLHAVNFSLCYLAGVHHFRRETREALERATESLELAREQGFATWRGASQMIRGEALVSAGSSDEGFAEIVAGLNAHSGMDAISYQTFSISVLVRGLLAARRLDEALEALEEGLTASEQRNELFYRAELLRLKGDVFAMKGCPLDAERWLHEAIALAKKQGARLFELRSAVSLCKLLDGDRRQVALRTELAPVCDSFATEVATPDLAEARALMSRRQFQM
jgi:class 3 adenylate cyclase/tetratricopeptide (TPR) repeat protein